MSESEPAQQPSFASALASKLQSFTSKQSSSFNNSPAHQSGKKSDPDNNSSLPDSLNNSSQDIQVTQPHQHQVKRRSIFATSNPNQRRKSSPAAKPGIFDYEHGKFNSDSKERKTEKLDGDNDNNILPEDINTPHHAADISFPVSLLSKEHSFDVKDSPPRAMSHRLSQLSSVNMGSPQFGPSQIASPQSSQSPTMRASKSGGFLSKLTRRRSSSKSNSRTPIKPKESLFKRGMNRLRNSIRKKKTETDDSKSVNEVQKSRDVSEVKSPQDPNTPNRRGTEADVVDDQPVIMLSRHQTYIGGRHESNLEAKQSSIKQDSEELKDSSSTPNPFAAAVAETKLVSPVYSHERLILSGDLLNPEDSRRPSQKEESEQEQRPSTLGLTGEGRTPFARSNRRARSTLERRPGSYGDQMLKIQAIAVKKAMREIGFKTFLMTGMALTTSLLFIFGVVAIISSLVALPFDEYVTVLWVGQLLHGMFLAMLAFFVLKVMIKNAREETEKNEEKHIVTIDERKIRRKYNDYDTNILGFFMIIISGLLMILLARFVPNCRTNPYLFVVTELITLVFNGAGYGTFYAIKNYFERKKVFGKKKHGFFFVPIYKDFMSDLYGVRDTFNHRETTSSPSSRRTTIVNKTEHIIKEEGIDKYKPKYPFQIVTEAKVIACQVLVFVSYLELMAVTGWIDIYNKLQERNESGVTAPLVLAYPIIIYIFAKIQYMIDEKYKLNLLPHVYYLNTAFAAMFFPIVLFHVDELGSVGIICGSKAVHKIIVYLVFGLKIDFWKMDVKLLLKAKFKSAADKKEAEKIEAILRPAAKRPSLKEAGRRDTLALKKIHDLEKEEELHNHKHHVVVEKFAMRFVMMQTNEILYSLAMLCLILTYDALDVQHYFMQFADGDKSVYIEGIWITLIVDTVLLMGITIIWSFSKTYSFIQVNSTFKNVIKKFSVDYAIVNLALFTTFLFLLQAIESAPNEDSIDELTSEV